MAFTVQSPVTDNSTVLNATYMDAFSANERSLRNGNDYYCKLFLDGDVSIANNNDIAVNWSRAEFQSGDMWSSGDPSHIIARKTGWHLFLPNIEWRANPNSLRGMRLHRSAGGAADYFLQYQDAQGGKVNLSGPCMVNLTAGQTMQLQVKQVSGGSLNIHGGAEDRSRLAVLYLGGDGSSGSWSDPAALGFNVNPTKGYLDQQLINNVKSLRHMNDHYIRVSQSTVQAVANNARTNMVWQQQNYGGGMGWTSGANPDRVTALATGTYLLQASIGYVNAVGNRRGLGYRINDTGPYYDLQFQNSHGIENCTGMDFVDLKTGDFIVVYGFQDTGAALNTSGTNEGDTWCHLGLWATGGDVAPLWTRPLDWVDGYPDGVITPAKTATFIRDNIGNLRNHRGVGARVFLEKDGSITPGERGPITWGRKRRNIGGMWDAGSGFEAPVDGIYLINPVLAWAAGGSGGTWGVSYRVDEQHINYDLQFQEGTALAGAQSAGDLVRLKKGQKLEFLAYQNGSDAVSLLGGSIDKTRATVVLAAATR